MKGGEGRGHRGRLWSIVVVVLLLIAPTVARAQAAALLISANGRDSWSGRLAAPNAAGNDGPFATVGYAQEAARHEVAISRRLFVRDSAYYLDAPLRLGGADAGLQILAYPGEHPVLYGGLPPSRNGNGGLIIVTPRARGAGLPILIAGGQRLPNARVPSGGQGDDHESAWRFADSSPEGSDQHSSFRVRSGDADLLAEAIPGTFVTIFGAMVEFG